MLTNENAATVVVVNTVLDVIIVGMQQICCNNSKSKTINKWENFRTGESIQTYALI